MAQNISLHEAVYASDVDYDWAFASTVQIIRPDKVPLQKAFRRDVTILSIQV